MAARNEAEARRLEALRLQMRAIIPFLDDETVIEIALNADGRIWVERMGAPMVSTGVVMSKDEAMVMLGLAADAIGTEISAAKPSLAALIPGWNARLQAMIPPVVEAPIFTIRKPPTKVFTLDDYVARGILTVRQADQIRRAVSDRANILVGGATGSGKSTFTNAILAEIAAQSDHRLYIVEDMRELQCAAQNKLQIFVQEPVYGWQRAIMDALRSRPDRIIVGELRGGQAALELVKAWNTGHPGGLCTVHANDTRGMLDRICQLLEEVIPTAPRGFVGQVINVCVHLTKDASHPAGRRISGFDKVLGLKTDRSWNLEPVR
ncbi:MAG TPA: P-type conjugative transfer ATPase TrbB [Polyangia bacterium]|nr:P-type conjugative transfer ATPase TrbB [Polyangia bacterium]